MKRTAALIFVLWLWSAPLLAGNEPEQKEPAAQLSPEEKEIIVLMETLQMMELVESMEMIEDMDILLEEDQDEPEK